MNEIETVVDVKRARDSLDLIIVRQKYRAEGSELQPVGPPSETRLGMSVRTVEIAVGTTTMIDDTGYVLVAHVRNNGFTVLDNIDVKLTIDNDDSTRKGMPADRIASVSFEFLPVDRQKRSPMLPGESRDWFLQPEVFDIAFGQLENFPAEDYRIVALVNEREEIGRLEGTKFRKFLETIPKSPRVRTLRRADAILRALPQEEQQEVDSFLKRLAKNEPEAWSQAERIGKGSLADGFLIRVNPKIRLVVTRVGPHLINVVDILDQAESVGTIAE